MGILAQGSVWGCCFGVLLEVLSGVYAVFFGVSFEGSFSAGTQALASRTCVPTSHISSYFIGTSSHHQLSTTCLHRFGLAFKEHQEENPHSVCFPNKKGRPMRGPMRNYVRTFGKEFPFQWEFSTFHTVLSDTSLLWICTT